MPVSPINLAIAEDHLILQRGIELILENYPNIQLTIKAHNGRELLDQLVKQQVDVILMDLEMPEMDGIEATKQIRKKFPDIKIILLTMHDHDQYITYLIELGVHAYLLKNEAESVLIQAIHSVCENDFFFTPYVQQALLKRIRKTGKKAVVNQSLLSALTDREKEVIRLVCKEYSSKEIAEKLFIAPRTVETHRRNIREKVGVKGTAGLVLFAIQHEIVDLHEVRNT